MFAFWREDLKAAASLARLDMADLSESLSRRRRCRNSNEWAVWVRVYPPALLYWSPRCSFFCTPRPTMAFFTRPQSASAAVKIVAPTAVPDDSTKSSPKKGTFLRLSLFILVINRPAVLQTLRNDNVGIFSSTGERIVLVCP